LDQEAVGWRLKLFWGATGEWIEAEVLSWDERKKKHHVLYLDGEEEWVDLGQEALLWVKASRHGAISAGHYKGALNLIQLPACTLAAGAHCYMCIVHTYGHLQAGLERFQHAA
jgi:hypothetical protein